MCTLMDHDLNLWKINVLFIWVKHSYSFLLQTTFYIKNKNNLNN